MIKEFNEFVNRGNVMDLAVAVIIGTAFGKIVDSFVKDIVTPLIPISDSGLKGWMVGKVAIGSFLDAILSFLILAFAVFLMVKAVNKMKKPEPVSAPAGPTQEELLTEIRDAIRAK